MKKLVLKFTTLIMIFALTLSFAGCSLFNAIDSGYRSPSPVIETFNNKAEFGRVETEQRTKKDAMDIHDEVARAVVAIKTTSGSGSGVIVDMNVTDENGKVLDSANEFYILTCHHVIQAKGDITVYIPDAEGDNLGESDYDEKNYVFKGEIGGEITSGKAVTLVGGDQKSDVALLKLTVSNSAIAEKIVKAKFPPSADYKMRVLEQVIAIGNPAGDLPGTSSMGQISYINRETSVVGIGALTLLQIDVHISHGSSGGGLFNLYGELIGITSAGRDPTLSKDEDGDVKDVTTWDSLNFAIPYIVDVNNGDSDYGFMNIAGKLLASKTSTNYGYVPGRVGQFGFTTVEGSSIVQITDVTVGSISAIAGVKTGDIIINVAKGDSIGSSATQVTTNAQVSAVFGSLVVGEKVTIRVYRSSDKKEHDITMTAAQYKFCDTGK